MSKRPSLFTPETRSAILARVEIGVPFEDAARAVGVKPNTAKSWLAKGRRGEGDQEYAAFAEQIERARAIAAERPEPMDEAELARVVSDLARAGSVQAAKLRWEMIRHERPAKDGSEPGSMIDQLAERRKRVAS